MPGILTWTGRGQGPKEGGRARGSEIEKIEQVGSGGLMSQKLFKQVSIGYTVSREKVRQRH